MSSNSKRKLDELDGSDTTPQSPTQQKMDVSGSILKTEDKEGCAQAVQPSPGASYLGERIVTVSVGPDKVKFILHEQALSQAAKNSFFHAAFNNGFEETATGYLELPEDDPEVFETLVKWIYAAHSDFDDFGGIFSPLEMAALFKLYVLAHKYLVNGTQDAIMSHLYDLLKKYRSVWSAIGNNKKAFEYFLADVPETSHLYRLVVRSMAYSMLQPTCELGRSYDEIAERGNCHNIRHDRSSKQHVDSFLHAVPDGMCRSIVEAILNVKTSGCCRKWYDVVGDKRDFRL